MKFNHNEENEDMEMSFTSVLDFKKYLKANDDYVNPNVYTATKDKKDTTFWSGVYKWSDFEEKLDNGDEELRNSISNYTKTNQKELDSKYDLSIQYNYDVEGLFFDVAKVVIGEPEAWLKEENYEEEKATYEFKVYGSYTSDVEMEDILKGASRVLAMAKSLEMMGVSTQVSYYFDSTSSSEKDYKAMHSVKMIAKSYDDGLNFKTASTIMHPSFFRRGIFRVREITRKDDLDAGMGQSDRSQKDYLVLDDKRQLDRLERDLFSKVSK